MKFLTAAGLLFALSSTGSAFHGNVPKQQSEFFAQSCASVTSIAKNAAFIVTASSLLMGPLPAAMAIDDSVYGALQTALIDASHATYPVLKSLTTETISPLANKLVSVATTKMDAAKLTAALNRGADALLGIPDEKVEKFAAAVKVSYEGVTGGDCSSVPLPAEALSALTASAGFAALDSAKVAAVTKKLDDALQAIPFSSSPDRGGLCLPATQEGLEKLWIGQAELAINIPRGLKQDFAAAAASAIGSVPNSDLLRVLPDAKKVLKGVDAKTAKKFELSGKTLDTVLKADVRFKALQIKS